MKKITLLLSMLLISAVSWQGMAQSGSSCDDPLTVEAMPFSDSGNTSTYGNNYTSSDVPTVASGAITEGTGSTSYLNGDDVVYSYTAGANGTISISTTNDNDWVGLWVFTGCPFTSTVGYHTATGGTTRSIPNLPVVAGETYYIVISTWPAPQSTAYTISITGTDVADPPTCLKPTALTVDAVDATTADLSWTEASTATEWEVLYGVSGFDPDSAGTLETVTGTPEISLTGLSSSTAYDFYVTAICSATDHSFKTGPKTFRTSCVPATIPFLESFESGYVHGDDLGNCWSQESIVETQKWEVNSTNTSYERTPRTGSYNVTLRYGNEDWMFYPLELDGGTPYQLSFYARQDGTNGSNASIEASYGTVDSASGMTNPIIPNSPLVNGDYQEFTGYFTPATSGLYYIGIKGTINFSPWYISLDDISIEDADGCLRPGNLAVTGVSSDLANVTWTESGTATEWDVIYGETGFDPATTGTTLRITGTA